MNCLKIVAMLGVLALPACETAQEIKGVTIDAAIVGFAQSNQQRQDWRGLGFGGQTAAYMACMADFQTKTVEEGFEAAQPLFELCMTLHADYKPDLFPVELAKDLKSAYEVLTDKQLETFGLPPRPE